MHHFRILSLCILINLCSAAVINYSFDVHRVVSNPDGYPRPIVAIVNSTTRLGDPPGQRYIPGPVIRARKGDTLHVMVHNRMLSENTAIHWHGLHMKNNNWMDGTLGVTQPPIAPMSMMTYEFELTQSGTFWYHAHAGVQYNDGLVGAIVVDAAMRETDPVKKRLNYVEDHVIMVQEWFHERAEDLFLGYRGPYGSYRNTKGNRFMPFYPGPPQSVLINGRGKFNCKFNNSAVKFFPNDCVDFNPSIFRREPFFGPCDAGDLPLDRFSCPAGKNVRIRLINSGVDAPIQFWIDRHRLTIVSRDAIDVIPVEVDNVTLVVGERMDVIVRCNQRPNMNYRMFARTYFYQPFLWSSAILSYNATGSNPLATALQSPDTTPLPPLRRREFEFSLKPLQKRVAAAATKRFVVQFNDIPNNRNGQPLDEVTVNNISFVMPKKPMLQEVFNGRSIESTICDEGVSPYGHRHLTNVIKLPYGEVVEIFFVALSQFAHPWHFHGYTMDFVAAGSLNLSSDFHTQGVKSNDCGNKITGWIKEEAVQRLAPPLGKEVPVITAADTFNVEGVSYVAFRLKLDNPGLWMFHCHINWHMEAGMAVVFSVERSGKYPGLLPPPKGFPTMSAYGA